MEKPFEFIECKKTQRDEFEVISGYQPTYAFLFIKDGSFRLEMDDVKTVISKNECAIFSDDINFFRTVIEPIHFIYLKFRINPKCPFNIPIPIGKVDFKNKERFLDSIKKYEEVMDSDSLHIIYYREHLLEDILLQAFDENNLLQEQNLSDDFSCHDLIVNVSVKYIRDNINTKIKIIDICNYACTNPSTLNFKFRKEFGCSTGQYIINEKMKSAKKYLLSTSYSVGEIALRCGFDNIYYFSSVFTKEIGLTPSEFRNIYR